LFAFQLEKNPVKNELILKSNSSTNANISITDLTGKTVYNSNLKLDNSTIIPLDIASGFYILNIIGENNSIFTTKFIINK